MKRRHSHALGQCDRCGFDYRLNQLTVEPWNGFRVCPTCKDPFPHQDYPRAIHAESTALVNARPRKVTLAFPGRVKDDASLLGRNFNGVTLSDGVSTPVAVSA